MGTQHDRRSLVPNSDRESEQEERSTELRTSRSQTISRAPKWTGRVSAACSDRNR